MRTAVSRDKKSQRFACQSPAFSPRSGSGLFSQLVNLRLASSFKERAFCVSRCGLGTPDRRMQMHLVIIVNGVASVLKKASAQVLL